jgi:hypothetical protein
MQKRRTKGDIVPYYYLVPIQQDRTNIVRISPYNGIRSGVVDCTPSDVIPKVLMCKCKLRSCQFHQLFYASVCNHFRQNSFADQSTQIPGTATFLNR